MAVAAAGRLATGRRRRRRRRRRSTRSRHVWSTQFDSAFTRRRPTSRAPMLISHNRALCALVARVAGSGRLLGEMRGGHFLAASATRCALTNSSSACRFYWRRGVQRPFASSAISTSSSNSPKRPLSDRRSPPRMYALSSLSVCSALHVFCCSSPALARPAPPPPPAAPPPPSPRSLSPLALPLTEVEDRADCVWRA